jgi:acyl-coenzyme A synthetase/AMP-(fatty) acid ligase
VDPLELRAKNDVAVISPDRSSLTYSELIRRADRFARSLSSSRKQLVALLGDRDLGTLVAYVAALRHGHTAAWFGAAREPAAMLSLITRYGPDIVVVPPSLAGLGIPPGYDHQPTEERVTSFIRHAGDAVPIEDETSVLLLTSGSMGASRAVRLGARAIRANSQAIAEVLGIDSSRRAATSLPLSYAYGLSVLNSHLIAGASLLITDTPATGTRFWREFASAGCASFAAVPIQLEWLAKSGVGWEAVPSLRAVTVSGARIRDALAQIVHQRAEQSGFRFHKMYGQSEATARISVLAHEDFPSWGASVGRVVNGSTVTITDQAGRALPDREVGRIVYQGPNAMLGYADDRDALSAPDLMRGTVDTGDIGYLDKGFLHLTGRSSRFVKPHGKRLALDFVEEEFGAVATAAAVGTHDEKTHVFVEGDVSEQICHVRREIAIRAGITPDDLRIHSISVIPRTHNGKVDYALLLEQASRQETMR